MQKYKVVEIFSSIEGEGKRQGQTADFIRLAGCNLSCAWCDTKHSSFKEIGLKEILIALDKNQKRVTLTGGEPLIHKNVSELILVLAALGKEVNIETNGSVDIEQYKKYCCPILENKAKQNGGIFFSIDYKLNSSGQSGKMHEKNFLSLSPSDVIKFVVGDESDIEQMAQIAEKIKTEAKIFITMVSPQNKGLANKIAAVLFRNVALKEAKLSLQLHKLFDFR